VDDNDNDDCGGGGGGGILPASIAIDNSSGVLDKDGMRHDCGYLVL